MAGYRPPRSLGLDRLLDEMVEALPAAPALITGAERTPVSFAELTALVDDLAGLLPGNGLRAGDLVALEAANSVEFVAGLLGAARAGMVVAPLDPALASSERTSRLGRLSARVVLTDTSTNFEHGDYPTWKLSFTPGRGALRVDAGGQLRTTPVGAPALSPDDRLIMFTAGTTSQPKMVPWTQQSITAAVTDICACYQLGPADSTVGVMPFFHGHGLVACLLATLASGGCVLLPPRGRFSAHTFWADVVAARATWFTAVPTMLEILRVLASSETPAKPETHLRFVRTCSAPLNPATARFFARVAGAPVLDAYGMTETTHQTASQGFPAKGPDKPHSVGVPTGVKLRIVGSDGHDCSSGLTGEIWVSGPTVTRGYLDDAADTAASFTDGWYHTGDLGTLDEDGNLTVAGRIKTLIDRGGEKISPEHVEEILDQDPAVAESAVLGWPDPVLGERVVALLVPQHGSRLEPTEVLTACRDRLARFEVPEEVKVVDHIPHSPKGTIDRTAIAAFYKNAA